MSKTRNKRLTIVLIICLALAVIIPNIFLFVFAGSESAWTVIGIVVGVGGLGIAIGVCGGLGGLGTAFTRGPIAPTTLIRLIYEELIKGGPKAEKKTKKQQRIASPGSANQPRVKMRAYSRSVEFRDSSN